MQPAYQFEVNGGIVCARAMLDAQSDTMNLLDHLPSDEDFRRIFDEEEARVQQISHLPSDEDFRRIFDEEEARVQQISHLPVLPAFLEHKDAVLYFDVCLAGVVRARRCKDTDAEQAHKRSMLQLLAEDVRFHNGECTLLSAYLKQRRVAYNQRNEIRIFIVRRLLQHFGLLYDDSVLFEG